MKNHCIASAAALIVVTLSAAMHSIPANAHGDADKPLFVASDGADAGLCLDPQTPCASLSYALQMATKGSEIRLAAGTFPVASTEELFLLVSGSVTLQGGLDNHRDFRFPAGKSTMLTGVPPEFRDLLTAKGIHVIADTKDQDPVRTADAQKMLALNSTIQSSMAATPCSGGSVNGLPCAGVDLLSHLAFTDISARPTSAADVWGFVDLNTLREYAIVGYRTGTAVIDVTEADNPREVGYVQGQPASWRDIKVYQYFDESQNRWNAYAYVTTDGASDGLFIIDLTRLPHSVQRSAFSSDYSSAHNVYITDTDYATGVSISGNVPQLIIAGPNIGTGKYRSYSLAIPDSPLFSGSPGGAGYMHDASSMRVTDSRKDTQCVNAGLACNILFDFNETEIEIWDISNASAPARLGTGRYSGASYVHSGWWSEDKQYLFAHDELDEQRLGLPTTVRVFSVANLTNPMLVGSWAGSTNAIDHNGFVRGNRYYMSNYSRGLTVLDISNPVSPVAVGRLDTYPFSDGASFVGAWGAYPFFHSSNVAISDIGSGLYMAKDQTRQVAQGSFSFADASLAVTEGGQATITVNRVGGSVGATSVSIEIVGATTDSADLSTASTTLAWGNGDAASKSFFVTAIADGIAETMEHALIRLIAPQGGTTLADNSTMHLFVSDAGASSDLEFLSPLVEVAERGFAKAILTVRRSGSAMGVAQVTVQRIAGDATSGVDYVGPDATTLTWSSGDARPQSVVLDMQDDGANEVTEFVEFQLQNANGATIVGNDVLRVNIGNGSGVNRAPNAVAGANQRVTEGAIVTLNGAGSTDSDGDTLTYQWAQTLGPVVALNNANSASASFTAPMVDSDLLLQFRLTVQDPVGQSDTANIVVTVSDSSSQPAGGSSGGGNVELVLIAMLLLMLLANATRRRMPERRYANG